MDEILLTDDEIRAVISEEGCTYHKIAEAQVAKMCLWLTGECHDHHNEPHYIKCRYIKRKDCPSCMSRIAAWISLRKAYPSYFIPIFHKKKEYGLASPHTHHSLPESEKWRRGKV